ncbi:MAG: hypothetical protein CL910_11885 [Deltaproteobacteria bacterium]|jgi:hypothetical protein|nr:hypothetical protein [Deltaproteobacteria bacterium]
MGWRGSRRFVFFGVLAAAGLLIFALFALREAAAPAREEAPRGAVVAPGPAPHAPTQGRPDALPRPGEDRDLADLADPVGREGPSPDRDEGGDDRDIEELKTAIYERRIDSIYRLHLLEELVRTGDTDTREYWSEDWSAVDDWKRASNGFRLEQTDDGTLLFLPDEETTRTYTFFESMEPYVYEEHAREFVSTVDFYGKSIRNVLKFIDDDVLVMMTISGTKVDLNIYRKAPAEK